MVCSCAVPVTKVCERQMVGLVKKVMERLWWGLHFAVRVQNAALGAEFIGSVHSWQAEIVCPQIYSIEGNSFDNSTTSSPLKRGM